MHEIIDIAQKDIKSVMTPRPNIIALDEKSDMEKLKNIILEKKFSKIPLFKDSLSNITGIIHTDDLLRKLLTNEFKNLNLQDICVKPVFVSEYSSLNYVIKELKKSSTNIAVILDEYGATIGIVTLNDIFREIFEEIEIKKSPIKKVTDNIFLINGNLSVEELNSQLNISLPEKKDYTTLSGLFIYHFGKFPRLNNKISVENHILAVKRMGKRKIEEIELTRK
jgi:putative hemolysin